MVLYKIDAKLLQKMFIAAAKSIEAKKEIINELNVFPVPDGDTGTNMTLTIMAAAAEVSQIENPTIESLSKAISSGSLRGARGNSGVILSQLFRGFTKEIKQYDEIDVPVISNAFAKAVETAYKAVMKPKEGTILTVARGGAERAAELVNETNDLVYFGAEVLKHMQTVLDYTPELLPVLKEAGVVDSGGQGLLEVMKGAYDAMLGKEIDMDLAAPTTTVKEKSVSKDNISTADIKFGYCTEFIILIEKQFDDDNEQEFKAYLESLGDSIVVVADDEVVKVHVHTNDPGLAIQKALTYGALSRMKIDNMREEHNEVLMKEMEHEPSDVKEESVPQAPRKAVGFVAVSIGEGVNEIFKGLGVDYLIEGGQTMNPSTEDVLNAIEKVNADTVFVLPNNKNIVLAANQARTMTRDKNIIVIPSETIPQGITAIISYIFDNSPEDNEKHMIDEMHKVKTGQVTYAVRDTNFDGKEIKQGNIMGIGDKSILSVGSDVNETAFAMISELVDEDTELISLYYGAEVCEEDAEALAAMVTESFPEVDVEVHFGGQPIYYYVVSVE